MNAVVLVEGVSDQVAVETLAARRGRDLAAEGVRVMAIGGAQAIGRRIAELGRDVRLAGMCDAREEPNFRRALERAGYGTNLDRAGLEGLGFYVCEADLEDELIRALGVDRVEAVAESQRELTSFRTFQKQPAQQGKTHAQQLHRWMGNRKIRYAALLVEALDLSNVPRPLDLLLASV